MKPANAARSAPLLDSNQIEHIVNVCEQKYFNTFAVQTKQVPTDLGGVASWLTRLSKQSQKYWKGKHQQFEPSVQSMQRMLDQHPALRYEVEKMIVEGLYVHEHYAQEEPYCIETLNDLLIALNYIITRAPEFQPQINHSAFPMSGLFVYMMYTPSGRRVFVNELFNEHLRKILNAWCRYLDSKDSLSVINAGPTGWLNPMSWKQNSLDQFVTEKMIATDPKHWTFTSFNDFFHRQIISICRPIDGIGNDRVIVSANDGTLYRIARNVQREDQFYLKNQNYSLVNMLDDSPYVDQFVGGDVVQSFLSGHDYHRWRSPISGKVVDQRVIPGFMFSELASEGFDDSAGTKSQAYEANVNTRGLVFIQSDDPSIGLVCVMPIGITEVSSVGINVKDGQHVEKGQELGWFSYGGSSLCLIFQPGVISQFTVPEPLEGTDYENGPFIRVNAQIAIAKGS